MHAKFSILAIAAVPIISVAFVGCSCNGDDGNTIVIPDAAMADAPPVVCTAPGSGYNDLAVGSAAGPRGVAFDYAMATCMYNPDGRYISWAARLENANPFDAIFVDFWAGYGVFSGGTIGSGTYQIMGDDAKNSTCGLCVMVLTDIVLNGNQISSYADWYFATSGTVQITSTRTAPEGPDGSGHFGVKIQNASLVHVTKNANGNPSDTVADACTTSISNFSIDSKLLAGSAGDCATTGDNGGASARLVGVSEDGKPIFVRVHGRDEIRSLKNRRF